MSDPVPHGTALIADVGGTNVRFALVPPDGVPRRVRALRAEDHEGLAEAAEAYLAAVAPLPPPVRAAFAVASPVVGDRLDLTNRRWSFSIDALRRRLGLERLVVVNDFAALALALPHFTDGDLVAIGGGTAAPGVPKAALGPGTGLGVAGLVPHHGYWLPVSGEGGHVTMAAGDDAEAAVLAWLRRRFDHVSAERVLSGPGLTNLYAALAGMQGRTDPAPSPEVINERAAAGSCPVCVAAVDMFCAMLGSVAGDLALTFGARGGVYVAGGIVPKLGARFGRSAFRARFEGKGRFSSYLADIPTWVVGRDQPTLVGLAALAAAGSAIEVPGARISTR